MKNIHLNFDELSKYTQNELKDKITSHYMITNDYFKKPDKLKIQGFGIGLDELFNRNNAGIDIDIFEYMK